MTTLDTLAQRYHQRPSRIMGIANDWDAYQFDLAVALIVEKHSADKAEANQPKQYAQPVATERVKIPDSGVW